MAGRSIIRLPFFISVINVCADFAPAVDARIVAGLVVTSVSGTEPGRTHQYCLCFVKGDPKKATQRLGDVELPDMQQFAEEED